MSGTVFLALRMLVRAFCMDASQDLFGCEVMMSLLTVCAFW
jgi:hypothetical protein